MPPAFLAATWGHQPCVLSAALFLFPGSHGPAGGAAHCVSRPCLTVLPQRLPFSKLIGLPCCWVSLPGCLGGRGGGAFPTSRGSAPFQRPLQGAACIAAISPLGRDPGVAEAQLAPTPLWWLGLRLCPCPATAPCPLLAALRPAFSPCDLHLYLGLFEPFFAIS